MTWDENLLDDQRTAATHSGSHARLLAGPGTGKTFTLTRRICFLIEQKEVSSDGILAVTFTRAAANELRQRVASELSGEENPRISTLHSFALRQLLRNEASINNLPMPLRIADDWEERKIVLEDIKALLELERISDARELLNEMSSDWQSLTADEEDWESRQSNPRFLGAWREHRMIYGYTLRSELVYQLKQAMELSGAFELDQPLRHLVVDEYQDLNRCDLAVIQQIENRGVELYVAGDDDQSIYGFRKAHPEGIRRFPVEYSGVNELGLEICMRCDKSILEIGLFVARQDFRRIEKSIRTDPDRGEGEVAFLRFDNQISEARGIARICRQLVLLHGIDPGDILILLRSDYRGMFSSPIREELERASVPVAATGSRANPLDESDGRSFLALTRLAVRIDDSLSWRTLFETWTNGVGDGAITAVYDLARNRGESFAQAILSAYENELILPTRYRTRLMSAIRNVMGQLDILFPADARVRQQTSEELIEVVRSAIDTFDDDVADAFHELESIIRGSGSTSLEDMIRSIWVSSDALEPEIEQGKVNILTMHRAKGLTAEAVIVAAADDEQIPGRSLSDEVIHDELRLLYVSLTRAKHHLFVSYCDRRTGQQQRAGRNSGRASRSLTRFLVDSPHMARDGWEFVSNYGQA